ncbi:MAG: hypothetical protein WBV82_08455 [Myxococcaceae bacterium]
MAFHAVAAGLSPLIPVPLLDDVVMLRIRQHMVRTVLGAAGGELPERAVVVLAGVHVPDQGAVERLARIAVALPKWAAGKAFKKATRKIALVLRVKECVDMASACLHHGWLLQHAWTRGHLDSSLLAHESHVHRVYAAIHAACAEMDPRPLEQMLRRLLAGGRVLGSTAARALASRRQSKPVEIAPDEADGLWERLFRACWEEQGYFQSLAQRYERHLGAPELNNLLPRDRPAHGWPLSPWTETCGTPTSSG